MNTAALPLPPVSLCTSTIPARRGRRLVLRFALKRKRKMEEVSGTDSTGRQFSSANEMWREEIGEDEAAGSGSGSDQTKLRDWYSKGISYWQIPTGHSGQSGGIVKVLYRPVQRHLLLSYLSHQNLFRGVEASVEGVLGGYGCVNDSDVKGSEAFLKTLLPLRFGKEKRHLVALDCGAGIGRVTKNLLLRHFNEVDLVEPVSHFLEAARENLSSSNIMQEEETHKATNFYCVPLQEFSPQIGRYDVIWVQWCIGHLPDEDFISFFKRAKVGLKANGFFIVKENIARGGFVLDKDDQSITRSDIYFRDLFDRCGLYLHSARDQKEMPEELFPVKMYCLVTEKPQKGGNDARKRKHSNRPAIIKS